MPQPDPQNRKRIVINLDDDPQPQPARPQQVQPIPPTVAAGGYQRSGPQREAYTPPQAQYQAPRGGATTPIPPAKPRSRVKRVLTVLAVLLLLGAVVLGAGGFLYWQNFKTTPAYSLALLADAAQRGDTAAFNERIDVDKITANFVPQVTEKLNERLGGALAGPLKTVVDAVLPAVLPGVKNQVREELNKKVKEIGASSKDYPFPLVALGTRWRASITENGDTATVQLMVKDRPIELTMQRDGDLWKVVGAKDDAIAQNIVEQVVKRLPASGKDKEKNGDNPLGRIKDEVEKRLPGLKDLKDQLPEGVREQLPDAEKPPKEAEERGKKETGERAPPAAPGNPPPMPKPSPMMPKPPPPKKPENMPEP